MKKFVCIVVLHFFFFPVISWPQKSINNIKITRKDYTRLQEAIQGNDEEAIFKAVSEILGKDSNNLKALHALGHFYFSNGQSGMAKLIYNRALKAHKNAPSLHNNLGVIYLDEGDLKRAIAFFEEAIALKRSYSIARINLSSIYASYGDYRRALEPLESGYKSFKLKSAKTKAEKKIAIQVANNYAVALMGLGKTKEANRVLKKASDMGGDDTFLLYNYGVLLIDILKDRDKALRVVSKLKFNTDDPVVLLKVNQLEERLDKL